MNTVRAGMGMSERIHTVNLHTGGHGVYLGIGAAGTDDMVAGLLGQLDGKLTRRPSSSCMQARVTHTLPGLRVAQNAEGAIPVTSTVSPDVI